MKNILLLVHDDEGQEARLQSALDVARALEGHLSCLDVAIFPNIPGDFYGASAMVLDDERTRESANRAVLEKRLGREGVPWDWHDTTGTLAISLARAATLADLIVVNRALGEVLSSDMQELASRLLEETATPVLAVPDDARSLNVLGHALVAWDGSPTAGAALHAATPLLTLAEKVTIVEVAPEPASAPAKEAASYLSRHGVRPDVVHAKPIDKSVGARLLMEARNRGADYIVMGGFGHSRIREAFFGGVTRMLLGKSPIPLLLAR